MMYIKDMVVSITLSLILISCSGKQKNVISDNFPSDIYASTKKMLQNGNYKSAIKYLEVLDNQYPFYPYAQQVQLDLIFSYYKSGDLLLAKVVVDRFLRQNPTHPNIDYVLYIRGLINMALDDSELKKFFGIDRSNRNLKNSRMAFRDLTKLVKIYPKSQYSLDATKRLIYLKNQLAKYELSVIKYYSKRGAYVAVINRVEKMLRDFPDTQATRQALPYMKKAYQALGLNSQANKVKKIIELNLI